MAAPAARLLQVAAAHRIAIRYFALSWLLGYGGSIMMRPLLLILGHSCAVPFSVGMGLLSLCSFAASVVVLVQVYRLAEGIGAQVPLLWVLGMLLPCLSLFVLLALISKSVTWLRVQGVPAGYMGPGQEIIQQLQSECGIGCQRI